MSSKSPGPKRKTLIIKILMLDDSEIPFQIESKTTGNELINLVYQYLKLVESDYFGLEFIDSKGKKNWLDYDKPVAKQIQNNSKLIFCVKFYTPDPGQLEEEYTRYLFALQIKRDLGEGLLLCTDATASLLASYILQAEIGDYSESFNPLTFFQNKKFFPQQNHDHQAKIIDYYKNHIGQMPADADMNLLDIARKIELYGIMMHAARDHEGVQLNLAVAHMGILVFQNYTKINTFSWAKIRKLSFKRKKFLVKLHPENYGFYKDTVEFYFENRDDSKNFWKKCIEHHAFFRCISAQRMPRQKSKLLTRGSSFRYYGRTQKELIENARENLAKNRSFDRSYHSMRNISHYNYSGSSGAINFHPQGTQSLNRNLASRSSGAILQPGYATTGHGSTNFISSTDSVNLYSNNQHHDYNDRTIDSKHSLGKEKALALSDHEDCDDQNTDEDCDEDRNEEKQAETSTFKPPMVSLPIQQEKKAEIERSNPNKIYSRKEVIQTTYKEEFLHTTTTTNLYSADKLSPSSSSPSSSSSNQNPEAHEDDDEDADKKARCSLAAQIILSNMKKQNEQQKIRAYERIRRPISPIKTEPSYPYRPTLKQNIRPRPESEIPAQNLDLSNQKIELKDYQQPVVQPATMIKPEASAAESLPRKNQIQDMEAFSIFKELVMTERTYRKDLDLVTILFKQFANKHNFSLADTILFDILYSDQALLPLAEFHANFLTELEARFQKLTDKNFENLPTSLNLGDLFSTLEQSFKFYNYYIQKYDLILNELEQLCKKNKKFDAIYKEFESLKICYLPFSLFLFKPIQRVIHYKILIERLLITYGMKHSDYPKIYIVYEKIDRLNDFINEKISSYENAQKLLELEKDLLNFNQDSSKRNFIREGSLQKLSRKGYQQRMFFLFDDILLYCAKCSTNSGLQFKVHGEFLLRNVQIEDGNAHISMENSFTIHSFKRSLLLCAVNEEEKTKWMQDFYTAIEKARNSEPSMSVSPKLLDQKSNYSTLKSNSSSDNNLDLSNEDDQVNTQNLQHRANTTMHVCWHRNTSVGANDIHRSNLNQLSGYLLRKFKNSNGWQKLWVVFTNFCLFFYKTYCDEYPLASLPLLGYSVTVPSESDNISKDFVFKLQFKNHVYFFRAESQYSFDRWLEVTESAVQKKCLFNMND